jgi:hypothetical protein
MAGRKCSVCAHPQAKAIDKALRAGESTRKVSSRYGLNDASMRRHKATHTDADIEIKPTHSDAPENAGPRTRAAVELIPQPHGGALYPPWPKGKPAAKRKPIKQITREIVEKIADDLPTSAETLSTIATSDEDTRNRLVAIKLQWDIVAGHKQPEEPEGALFDLTGLSDAELVEVQTLIARLRELTGRKTIDA